MGFGFWVPKATRRPPFVYSRGLQGSIEHRDGNDDIMQRYKVPDDDRRRKTNAALWTTW